VLRSACAQASAWHGAGLDKITVAINMASPSFKQLDLLTVVADALEKSGPRTGYLELEVTESIMMHDMEAVLTMLKKLKGIASIFPSTISARAIPPSATSALPARRPQIGPFFS